MQLFTDNPLKPFLMGIEPKTRQRRLQNQYLVCGYIIKGNAFTLVLGQYNNALEVIYKGHVSTGFSIEDLKRIIIQPKVVNNPFLGAIPATNNKATWIYPFLVCSVECQAYAPDGEMLDAVYQALHLSVQPEEVLENFM